MSYVVRSAAAADTPFLAQILAIAANWDPSRPSVDPSTDPHLIRYLARWHTGVVVEHDDTRIAAAWLTHLTSDEPGYGYLDDTTPELTIGIVEGHRGHGIGGLLLTALLHRAPHTDISLSVEHGNDRAWRLYERLGFVTVAEDATARTMLRSAAARR